MIILITLQDLHQLRASRFLVRKGVAPRRPIDLSFLLSTHNAVRFNRDAASVRSCLEFLESKVLMHWERWLHELTAGEHSVLRVGSLLDGAISVSLSFGVDGTIPFLDEGH